MNTEAELKKKIFDLIVDNCFNGLITYGWYYEDEDLEECADKIIQLFLEKNNKD